MTELDVNQVMTRLQDASVRFGAAIRAGRKAGMTPAVIGELTGLKSTEVRQLIERWGLDT